MKKIILLFVLSVILGSCKVTEKPEFIKVNSVEIIDTSLSNFTILAKLQFKNKNSIGGTLQANNIHVFIDSIDVATINSELFDVPKKSEFELPLEATIPFSKVYENNKKGLLNNILNIVSSKKINILYKGEVKYKLGAFSYDYPLSYSQEIEIIKK